MTRVFPQAIVAYASHWRPRRVAGEILIKGKLNMELTDASQDFPDCRPLNRNNSIRTPTWLQVLVAERRVERAARHW